MQEVVDTMMRETLYEVGISYGLYRWKKYHFERTRIGLFLEFYFFVGTF